MADLKARLLEAADVAESATGPGIVNVEPGEWLRLSALLREAADALPATQEPTP